MAEAALALNALGSDLSFSVSFAIARELLDAAKLEGVSEDELVAIVLALSVALSALPRSLETLLGELRRRNTCVLGVRFEKVEGEPAGLAAFVKLLIEIAQRISVSVSVQLLAGNVRALQPLRAVRIVTLLSVAVFFLFLVASSSIASATPQRSAAGSA